MFPIIILILLMTGCILGICVLPRTDSGIAIKIVLGIIAIALLFWMSWFIIAFLATGGK